MKQERKVITKSGIILTEIEEIEEDIFDGEIKQTFQYFNEQGDEQSQAWSGRHPNLKELPMPHYPTEAEVRQIVRQEIDLTLSKLLVSGMALFIREGKVFFNDMEDTLAKAAKDVFSASETEVPQKTQTKPTNISSENTRQEGAADTQEDSGT